MIIPLRNKVLVADCEVDRKSKGGIDLPDASIGHEGTIQAVFGFRIGRIMSVGPLDKQYSDLPTDGYVMYAHGAGKRIIPPDEHKTFNEPCERIIHIDEIFGEVEDYDGSPVRFV